MARFEGRSSLRSWLYTVATRTCLTAAERRGKRALPVDVDPSSDRPVLGDAPLADIARLGPYPDSPDARFEQRESVEPAFVAALQHPARAGRRATAPDRLRLHRRAGRGDTGALVALLTEDVTAFAVAVPLTGCGAWRRMETVANGQPAAASYLRSGDTGPHMAWSIGVLTVRGDRIAEVTSFIGTEHFTAFGLPAELT